MTGQLHPDSFDAVVVGLGAMGSATVYQLAKAGAKVLGLDRHSPPHPLGSTHGDTRITRLGIGEGHEYVPLVVRSHQIWREIESQTGHDLLRQCGGLVMAGPDTRGLHGTSRFLNQTIASAERYGVEHEILSSDQITARFPQFALRRQEIGYFEPSAGYLRPEKCVAAQLSLARSAGAEIATGEAVLGFSDDRRSVRVETSQRSVTAKTLVVTAGPWVGTLVPDLSDRFRVYRQVMYWFDLVDKAEFEAYANLPVYIWEFGGRGREQFIYGFPMIDGPEGGVKVATEDYTTTTSPDAPILPVSQEEVELVYQDYVRDQLPGLGPTCVKAVSCLYTVTQDSRFIIDRHPSHPNVIVASPCSGHGFKHSAAIGEVLAQLVTCGSSDIDIAAFALTR